MKLVAEPGSGPAIKPVTLGKVVASDDDGLGNLNSRLVFPAKHDVADRVIAATLAPATGGFKKKEE